MWHLKTRMGVFWVVPAVASDNQFLLGVNDQELALYPDAELAAKDVHDQSTGFLKWDSERRVKAPEHISEWVEGEPKDWQG